MERPSAIAVFAESWSGARAALRRRPRFYWVWYAAAAGIGGLTLLIPSSLTQPTKPGEPWIAPSAIFSLVGWALMMAVLGYFVLADTVRTFVPSFRMTLTVFALQFIVNIAYNSAVQLAAYCLIIPAFYVGPKLWLWFPNYLLTTDGENHDLAGALTRSWTGTDGIYWPTFGLMALVSAASTAILIAAIVIGFFLVQSFNPLTIVTMPLLTFFGAYICAEIYHAWLGWAVAIGNYAEQKLTPAAATI